MDNLAVVGLGLASPAGATSIENVFFLRAGEPSPGASPFVDAEGETIPVAYAPYLGARAPLDRRCVALLDAAFDEALGGVEPARLAGATLHLTAPALPEDRIARRAASRARVDHLTRATFAAAVFEAIASASARRDELAIVAAVDSWIDLGRLADRVARPPNPWINETNLPAEAAAVLVLATPDAARARGLPVLATIHGAASHAGESTDDDDEPIVGRALAHVLRALPSTARIGSVFGQQDVDRLRHRDWEIATARVAERFEDEHASVCFESEVGLVGAAAGAAGLAFGIASSLHRTLGAPRSIGAPLVAWAIGRDGLRGAALATVEGP